MVQWHTKTEHMKTTKIQKERNSHFWIQGEKNRIIRNFEWFRLFVRMGFSVIHDYPFLSTQDWSLNDRGLFAVIVMSLRRQVIF